MRVELTDVSKGGGRALPATTVRYAGGEAVLARAETEQRPSVLGLIASGRMRPDTGTVTLDGAKDPRALRRRVALVDAPEVCEPAPDVTVAGVVAEELMFAGRRSHLVAVRRTLEGLGLASYARWTVGTLPPTERIRLLAELALLRKGVEGLVITSPDRHGGAPAGWWSVARTLAGRGHAVLVIAGEASAAAIGADALVARLGETAWASEDGAATVGDDPGRDDTDALPLDTLRGRGILTERDTPPERRAACDERGAE